MQRWLSNNPTWISSTSESRRPQIHTGKGLGSVMSLFRYLESAHSSQFDSPVLLKEREFRMEGMRDTTQNVLYTLNQLSREYPEIQDVLDGETKSRGLILPSKPAAEGDEDRENDSVSHNTGGGSTRGNGRPLQMGSANFGFGT